jgi:hypothetical protein
MLSRSCVLLVASAAVLPGCVTPNSVAKSMYAAQYNCPEENLVTEDVAVDRAIMVRGCGYRQLYACSPKDVVCVRDGERTPIEEKSTASGN